MIKLYDDRTYTISDIASIMKVAITKGNCTTNKKIKYKNIICAFDIETTSFIDELEVNYRDEFIYNYIKGTTIKVGADLIYLKSDCPSGIKLSLNTGIALDEFYEDLSSSFPYYFPSIIASDDQIRTIFEVYEDNMPTLESSYKHSIMYIWQLAIDGKVIIGRTWEEFLEAIDIITGFLKDKERLIIYVHNLQFEFQFIRTFFTWSKVFSISPRKPIYAITDCGIEFRCSYILTNYSLAKLADQLHIYHIEKKVGDLDYDLYRSPETPLSEEEIQYCINDVLVVSAYIQEQILKEKYICNIPLTATGYARRYVRSCCFYDKDSKKKGKKYKAYQGLMKSLMIKDKEEYLQLKRAFQGGFTHPSALYSGKIMKKVKSIDFTSSYPFTCISEAGYPMSSGKVVEIQSKAELENYLKHYCCIFDLEIEGLTSKMVNENYLSESHCYKTEGLIVNNGRVVSADKLITTITEIDYKIIKKTYNMKVNKFHNFRIYKKGYLPKDIIKAIIKLYKDKTILKGVKGKEVEYLNSKALLNSIYGMMCTDMCKDEIIYNDTWDIEPCDIDKAITKYNNSGNRFTFYPWALYVTAFARYNLWSGILAFGDDYIYSDTDSIKCTNLEAHMDYVNGYNRLCEKKLNKMCSFYNLDPNDLKPKTIKGEEKPLGVWDIENDIPYERFKTIGAKRYIYTEEGKLHMTVAGVNKKTAVPYLLSKYDIDTIFDIFKADLVIPPEGCGKMNHCYIDSYQEGVITDYLGIKYKYRSYSGIYLEKIGFQFKIPPAYLNYLKGVQMYK